MAALDFTQVLSDATELLRNQYVLGDEYMQVLRPRDGLPAYFSWGTLPLMNGDKIGYEVETSPYAGARHSGLEDPLPTAGKIQGKKVWINIGATNTDVRRLSGSIEITEEDRIIYSGDGSVVPLVDKLSRGLKDDMVERLCHAMWGKASGRLCTIQNATQTDGTALDGSAEETAFRFEVKDGSPNFLIPNLKIEIYNSTTSRYGASTSTVASTCVVTDVMPSTTTKGVNYVYCALIADDDYTFDHLPAGTVSTGSNYGTYLADDAVVYRSGEYGSSTSNYKCPYGLDDWFDPTVNTFWNSAGAQWDRDAAGNSWYSPLVFDPNSGSLGNMDLRHLDIVWPALQRQYGDGRKPPQGLVMLTDPDMWINIKNLMAANNQTLQSNTELAAKYFGVDGLTDLFFLHPAMGPIALNSSVHAPQNKLRIIDPSTFKWVKTSDIQWAPGSIEGMWSEKADTENRYLAYRADQYLYYLIVCLNPSKNVEVKYVRSVNT